MRPLLLSISALLLTASLPGATAAQSADPAPDAAVEAPAAGLDQAPEAAPAAADRPAYPAGGDALPERAAPPRTLRAYWHVFAAFAVTWVLLFGYALSLGRRFGRLDEEVRRLGGAAD